VCSCFGAAAGRRSGCSAMTAKDIGWPRSVSPARGRFVWWPEGSGAAKSVGEHLKYLVWGQGRPVACLAWSSAPRHLGSRDRYIGWSAEARRRNVRFIAYNTRFLILPWVKVEHLASHILGRMASQISADWQRIYGHPIYFLETFVDPERFRGTCYRAANWVSLGKTTSFWAEVDQPRESQPLTRRFFSSTCSFTPFFGSLSCHRR
jgi:hypothetical protein